MGLSESLEQKKGREEWTEKKAPATEYQLTDHRLFLHIHKNVKGSLGAL
jgi:hypothetical protein